MGGGSSQSITIVYNISREGGPAKVLQYYNRGGGVHFSIKSCGFRIRRYDMCFYKLKTFLMHKDLNVFISWVFRGLCRFEKINREGQIKILEGGQAK